MSNWPIIKQIALLLGAILRFIYSMLSLAGIQNLGLAIVVLTILSEIILIPASMKQARIPFSNKLARPKMQELKNLYGECGSDIYKTKYNIEIQRLKEQYGLTRLAAFFPAITQMSILIALYAVIADVKTYIPELNNLTDAQRINVSTFLGINLHKVPEVGLKISFLIPLLIFATQILQGVLSRIINNEKIKISVMDIYFAIMMSFFAMKSPSLIGVYWIIRSACSMIKSFAFGLYYKNKDDRYYVIKHEEKLNASRIKRGLEAI